MTRVLTGALVLLLVAGCATAPACRDNESVAVVDSLYFGTDIPSGGTVTAEQWESFLTEVITARFPEGLSSWGAAGQWRDNSGKLVKEGSHVLNIAHPATQQAEKAIRDIMSIYKERFRQEAVLRVRTPGCISF